MKTRKQIAVLIICMLAFACFAGDPVRVQVFFRLQQSPGSRVAGTPETVAQSIGPSLSTNVVLSDAHQSMTPLQLYLSVFGTKAEGIEYMFGMEVLRYEPVSTNYVVVERFWFKDLKSDTNFTARLQQDDVLFFHGHVD